jgi:hypothetical protein
MYVLQNRESRDAETARGEWLHQWAMGARSTEDTLYAVLRQEPSSLEGHDTNAEASPLAAASRTLLLTSLAGSSQMFPRA